MVSKLLEKRLTGYVFPTAPGDYGAIVSQSVTFGPSDTLLNVTVPINDDSVYELDEMFTAVLNTNDPGVVLFDATATATITDDDGKFIYSGQSFTHPAIYIQQTTKYDTLQH